MKNPPETDLFGNTLYDEKTYPREWVERMHAIIDRRSSDIARESANLRPYYVVKESRDVTWIING